MHDQIMVFKMMTNVESFVVSKLRQLVARCFFGAFAFAMLGTRGMRFDLIVTRSGL
jgi:hypothetical protein